MPKSSDSITIEKKMEVIAKVSFFAVLEQEPLLELANLCAEKNFACEELIVNEGDLVDAIYIIVAGTAEVTRIIKKKKVILASLTAGDVIGLNTVGFFSSNYMRTATVSAITATHLLSLSIEQFNGFIARTFLSSTKNLPYDDKLRSMGIILEKMQFLKKSLPFANHTPHQITQLAEQIEEINYEKDQLIFEEGQVGDRCYLIRSGKVAITITLSNSEEKFLAELTMGDLFGEMALLTSAPRNATARTKTEVTLLALSREHLLSVIKGGTKSSSALLKLMLDRSRPKQVGSILIYEQKTKEGETIYLLKNKAYGTYFQLSEEGWFVWQQLDGNATLKELALSLYKQYGRFCPDEIAELIINLGRSHFVILPTAELASDYIQHPKWVVAGTWIKKIFEAQWTFANTDKMITQSYEKLGYILFKPMVLIMIFILFIIGVVAFGLFIPAVSRLVKDSHHLLAFALLLIPLNIFSIIAHEFSHALTAKHFGREVNTMGFGWYWIAPMAFADTSDMWLSPIWQRIAVNLAGVISDAFFGSIAAISAWFVSSAELSFILWIYALSVYMNIVRNINPLLETDGYYVLMDLLDSNLRRNAFVWLIYHAKNCLRYPILCRQYKKEIIYWLSAVLYMLLLWMMIYIVQYSLIQPLVPSKLFHFNTNYLRWFIPLAAIALSFLVMFAEIKKEAAVYKVDS